jgi:arylsulfatase
LGAPPRAPCIRQTPFAFTGTVKKALVDVTSEAVEDMAAKMKMYLARQ